MGTVQYNDEGRSGLDISKLCDTMTSSGDPYDNLRAVNQVCTVVTMVTCFANPFHQHELAAPFRQKIMVDTCTEDTLQCH